MRRWSLILAVAPGFAAACDRGSEVAVEGRGIRVGTSSTGTLGAADPTLRNRGPYHVWTLRGRRGQRLVIDLTSSAFDAYVYLRDAEGFLIGQDDDSGDDNSARLRTILPRDGMYRIVTTSYAPGASGDYTLSVSEWATMEGPAPGRSQSLGVRETHNGVLEPGDEFSGDGPYQDRWILELQANQRVRVEMRSTEIDSYLLILGPDGRVVATDDDGLGNRDAGVAVRPAAPGRYTALATTFGDQPRVGAYRIALSEVTGEFAEPGTVGAIAAGETKTGQLEAGDSTTASGGYADIYEFRPSRSGTAVFDLSSTDFDTYLTLRDAGGQELTRNDDVVGGNTNSQITWLVNGGSVYRLVVSAFGGGTRSGGYRLTARMTP